MERAPTEDAQPVTEYLPDITALLHSIEAGDLPKPDYLDAQPEINDIMRATVVDWLTDVHRRFKLRQQTLFLAVGLLDRFLSKQVLPGDTLQLASLSSLLIAAKFEEISPPQIQELLQQVGASISKDEVIRMEASMLMVLGFKVCWPTSVSFLELYQRLNGCTSAHRDLTRYLLELTLVDYSMLRYMPSHLAAAAVWLSNRLLRRRPSWSPEAVRQTGITEQAFKKCAREMCVLLEQADQGELQAVRRKYSHARYHEVAKMDFAAPSGHAAPIEECKPPRRQRRAASTRLADPMSSASPDFLLASTELRRERSPP